ncbi:MAG: ABC transporter permease [Acidobacteriota bacterium]
MVWWEALKVALSNLGRHKLRTGLTMLGMIFGVAAVLAMTSIGAGAEQEALAVIRRMGLQNLLVRAKSFEEEEQRLVRQESPGLTWADGEALVRALPKGTRLAAKREVQTYLVASEVGRSDSKVLGVSSLYPYLQNLEVTEGAFFLDVDDRMQAQVCVLGSVARRRLFGLNPAVGRLVKINDLWFEVIGVLADQLGGREEFQGVRIDNPNNEIFIPLSTALHKFERNPLDDELDELVLNLPAGANLYEAAEIVSSLMGTMHRNIDDFTLVVPLRLLAQSRRTQQIFNIVMGSIASISLLVGGIGIMNIMLASVLERTSEIGLRRAVGARRRDISRQFVLEAVTVSCAGAVLGIGAGFGLSELVAAYSGWPTRFEPYALLLGVGVSVLVGLVFGIYPARQAARISPIEALRYE